MKANAFHALALLPTLGWAFPQMAGVNSREEMLEQLKQQREEERVVEKRSPIPDPSPQLLSGLGGLGSVVGSLTGDITGLLGSVASAISPDNKRPEAGYTFKAPGPNDSRGPCPGLNLLANYGYLPRNGYVNLGQVIQATARGFNMAADLSTLLGVFAVLTDGDIATESWYLGTSPTKVGGLNRHSTVEADISPNREDYYNGCGDNHHLSSRLFKQNVALAAASKDFGLTTMANQYLYNSQFSQTNNPYLYYFPFPSIVSLGAFAFYPNFFSNGTYGAGGVANYESISSIIGARYNSTTGEFEYVPERWPEQGWYRRATPYGAVQTLTDGFGAIYTKNPVAMPIAQLGTSNLTPQTILCDVVMGLNSITPLALAGQAQSVEAEVTWALAKLGAVGISSTILGCPASALSPDVAVYPNSTNKGGPLNPPASVAANTGNNVYGKTYFAGSAPTTPKCSHTS
ncbi:hypothetical protein J7T55_015147 [Diaporthe amygdali]|uniref:uncharacterized protein n=1 Tax=Phomopsis amygdali TaxID=1214568 RepID=UPI0022FF1B48|nr:uncharacterized protein J7T55_015147 [Diaporthe amygdali]KAJ0120420.1 hypothetical protein J7T55_015147 [Diaporthe amygdali]